MATENDQLAANFRELKSEFADLRKELYETRLAIGLLKSAVDTGSNTQQLEKRVIDLEVTAREGKASREGMAVNIRWLITAMIGILALAISAFFKR